MTIDEAANMLDAAYLADVTGPDGKPCEVTARMLHENFPNLVQALIAITD